MNVIYLSPHFPKHYAAFSVALKNLGAKVLGIGESPYDELSDELKGALTEYYRVDSMEDYSQLYKAVAFLAYKHGKIDRLDSLNEYWLEKEAMLRTDFNITGVKIDTIYDMKKKSLMKEKFRKAGVEVAAGKVINDLDTALEFAREVGFPIVTKPDNGVGALNTYKINSIGDIISFFKTKPAADYIFEEFVDGQILTFDGLVDKDGNLVFYTGHVYQDGVMETVNDDKNIYYYSVRELPADLEEAGRNTIKAFDLKERFFHFEFFRRYEDDKIVALEVNMRPPGGYTTDMFNYANDINIYQEWANILVENKFKSEYSRKYHCAYVGRKARFNYVNNHEAIMSRYGKNIPMSAEVAGVFSTALGNFCYIVRSENLSELKEIISFIQQHN